ncbi:MAG: carbon-nitrogen hydrolase, partial [Psychrobacter sp.]|nr:carbon-nitrogen hydrolase [Psychrobacter sp.]
YESSEMKTEDKHKDYALVFASLDKSAQQQGREKMPIFQCHRLA